MKDFQTMEDTVGIQRRMAFVIQKREEIWTGLKKELPVDVDAYPNVEREYEKLYDAFDRLIREEARSLVDLQQSNPFEQNGLGIKKEVSMDGIRGDLKEIIRLLGKIETKLPEKDVGKIAAGMAKEINHVLQSRVDKTDSKKA